MYGNRIVKTFARLELLTYAHETKDNCPCGGTLVLPTDNIELLQCLRCGMIGRRLRLDRFSTAQLYRSGLYRRLHGTTKFSREDFERGVRRGKEIMTTLVDNHIHISGKTVLELGCGPGGILEAFRQEDATVFGFDLDPMCVQEAQKHGLTVNDASISTSVDIVILSHCLEHSYNPDEMMYDCMAWLGSGGYIYIETPTYKPGQAAPVWHNWYFSKPAIHLLAARMQMRPIVVKDGVAIFQWGASNDRS